MMRMLGPGGRGGGPVGRTRGWSGRPGRVRGVRRLLACRLFWSVGGRGWVRLFFFVLAWAAVEVVGLGGVALEEGVCSLLAWVSQRGLCQSLHGRLRSVSREVGEFPYRLRVVGGPWQCSWAVLERVVEVVVPHGLCLPDPGFRAIRCVWTN